MNITPRPWIAVPLAALVIGPPVQYLTFIVRFGLGITSSMALTRYYHMTLAMGVVVGLISGMCVWAARGDLRRSALLAGVLGLSISSVLSLATGMRPGTPPLMYRALLLEALVTAASVVGTALLTAAVTNRVARLEAETR